MDDSYLFGLILYELVTNVWPFEGVKMGIDTLIRFHDYNLPLTLTPSYSPGLCQLVSDCTRQRGTDRPLFPAIVACLVEECRVAADDADDV